MRFDQGTWTAFDAAEGLFNAGTRYAVQDAAVGRDGRLWVATLDGLSVIEGQSCRRYDSTDWRNATGDPIPEYFNHVRGLKIGPDGSVWFVGTHGTYRFDGQEFRYHYDASHVGTYQCSVIDAAGRVWLGDMSDSLVCIDGNAVYKWTMEDYLAGRDVRSLALDLDGSLWIGTEGGVSHIILEPDAVSYTHLTLPTN